MRQGNDVGSQYRSAIYFTEPGQRERAEASGVMMADALAAAGYGDVTTELADLTDFYYAEPYHQQYLHKTRADTARSTLRASAAACPAEPRYCRRRRVAEHEGGPA